jgi:hypothetical protein
MPDFFNELPVRFRTDRDCEMPILLKFLKDHVSKNDSLLDIGAHYSRNTYAPSVRPLFSLYDGIDVVEDPFSKPLLNHFFVGNAINYPLFRQ